jgi:hypothetical protein
MAYKSAGTAFKMHHTKDPVNTFNYWKSQSAERFRAANYLNIVAYNYPENHQSNWTELILKREPENNRKYC